MAGQEAPHLRTLVVDVGGNNVKFRFSGETESRKFKSGKSLSPDDMIAQLMAKIADEPFDRVSIGIPAPVRNNCVIKEPFNLGPGWVDFDFEAAFEQPVKVVNDALMQALGSYEGGTMLFLGLGTGLGGALVFGGTVAPLEVAHMPYKDGKSFEDFVGKRGLKALGREKWEAAVHDVVDVLRQGLVADAVVLGGGNAKRIENLPPHTTIGDNANAFAGGFRLWEENA